jgi:GNAT superfamily N-acetyltransferase
MMTIKELKGKDEMLVHLNVMQELYPTLTEETYSKLLDGMLPNNEYGQLAVFNDKHCVGIAGFWIGTKVWCGKYLEIDNLVVSAKHRSLGAGKLLFDYLSDKAQKEQCTMMALDSYTSNFKAHKFFYNEGFGPKGFHFIRILDENGIR